MESSKEIEKVRRHGDLEGNLNPHQDAGKEN